MSRIEQAMEKARELARKSGTPEPPPLFSANATVYEQIDIASRRLVAANEYNLPIAEEYRKLKSIVMQIMNKNPEQNLLLVSSSIGGEGKSLTALNLAISLAQEHNKQVLIIDADLRKPSIGNYLGLAPLQGLADCLINNVQLDTVLVRTGVGNLIYLPAGKSDANPVELYSTPKMKKLLDELKTRFSDGYIVIDASPVLPFAEARILASLADSVIYVIKEGGTSMKNIQAGLNALIEANIIGLVYNKATTAGLAGGYHYYYYEYDYQSRSLKKPPVWLGKTGRLLSLFRKSRPDSKGGESGHV